MDCLKALDRVGHKYILETLEKFDLHEKDHQVVNRHFCWERSACGQRTSSENTYNEKYSKTRMRFYTTSTSQWS